MVVARTNSWSDLHASRKKEVFMEEDVKRKVVVDHLRSAGFNEDRIERLLQVIPVEDAYRNLQRSKEWNSIHGSGKEGGSVCVRSTRKGMGNE